MTEIGVNLFILSGKHYILLHFCIICKILGRFVAHAHYLRLNALDIFKPVSNFFYKPLLFNLCCDFLLKRTYFKQKFYNDITTSTYYHLQNILTGWHIFLAVDIATVCLISIYFLVRNLETKWTWKRYKWHNELFRQRNNQFKF